MEQTGKIFQCGKGDVFAYIHLQHKALTLAILRKKADTCRDGVPWFCNTAEFAVDINIPAGVFVQFEN
jgi:hypothetical protein